MPVSPQNSNAEVPQWGTKSRLNEVIRVGPESNRISFFMRRDTRELAHSACTPKEGHARMRQERGRLQSRKRALSRNPASALIYFQTPEL